MFFLLLKNYFWQLNQRESKSVAAPGTKMLCAQTPFRPLSLLYFKNHVKLSEKKLFRFFVFDRSSCDWSASVWARVRVLRRVHRHTAPPQLSQKTILSKRLSNVSPFRCYKRPCNPYSVNLTNAAPRSRTRRSSNNKTLSGTVSSPNPIFYILTTYWNNFNFGGLCSGRNLKGFNLTLNHKSITQKYNSLNL